MQLCCLSSRFRGYSFVCKKMYAKAAEAQQIEHEHDLPNFGVWI